MFLLQLQSEKGEPRRGVNEDVLALPAARSMTLPSSLCPLSLDFSLLTVRASRET